MGEKIERKEGKDISEIKIKHNIQDQ